MSGEGNPTTGALSVVVLTFNSAASIGRTLKSVSPISSDIHVVDSHSTDDTVAICERFGCRVVQRPFTNYADQRNWAIDNLPLAGAWQLHLDADEELEPALAATIADLRLGEGVDGYILGRKIVFLGRTLRHGGIHRTWHMRLFRTGRGRCEDRLYDQHFVCSGPTRTLRAYMLDHQEETLSGWTARHNRWSDMECRELARAAAPAGGQVEPALLGSVIQRKRAFKSGYYRLPLFARALAYFFYRYILRLGFLDGRRGLIYHVLQGFWFRFLVDAKLYEAALRTRNPMTRRPR